MDSVRVQVVLHGEEASLWKLVKSKRIFLELSLKKAYKNDELRELLFRTDDELLVKKNTKDISVNNISQEENISKKQSTKGW